MGFGLGFRKLTGDQEYSSTQRVKLPNPKTGFSDFLLAKKNILQITKPLMSENKSLPRMKTVMFYTWCLDPRTPHILGSSDIPSTVVISDLIWFAPLLKVLGRGLSRGKGRT